MNNGTPVHHFVPIGHLIGGVQLWYPSMVSVANPT
jgi:hypothetical protein